LLEVLLALALGALLILAVGVAIDIHIRLVRTGRTEVERSQLARALLSRIANDLRGTVQYCKVDLSSYSVSASTSDNAAGKAGAAEKASSSSTNSTSDADESTDNTTNIADATQLPTVFGLYGNLKELRLDVVQSPRADQIQSAIVAESTSTESASLGAVKTITYYLASNAANASASGGLMRRDLDRWQAEWLAQQGELADAGRDVAPLAPEVLDIEFHYYDGTEWVEEWDTSQRSGLPMAVEVVLAIARPQAVAGLLGGNISAAASQSRLYRMTVYLPLGEPTTLSTTDSSTSSTSSGAGTN
jgi:hypothetical protein